MAGLNVTAGAGGTGSVIARDIVGTATVPASGDGIQYVKQDVGGAGLSVPQEGGTAANLAAQVSTKSALVVLPGQWSANHTPAAATQATITKAAGAAGVRHVCTSLSATLATIGTAQSTVILLNLRDGATGAGTILWSKQVVLPTNSVWEVSLSALSIVGTAATAMTLEFSAANAAASFASVAMTGYDTPNA